MVIKKRNEVQRVTETMVKGLRRETGYSIKYSKMVLDRFGGDCQFLKTFVGVAGHAISVKGDRDERDLRVTIEKMGRKPFVDNGFEEKRRQIK